MKKTYLILFTLVCIILLFCSCQSPNSNGSSTSAAQKENIYQNGLPNGDTINIDVAESNVYQKVGGNDPQNLFACEGIEFKDQRCFYVIRGFNDLLNNRSTFGWYAVDVFTGEVYDTHILTDWELLS